MNKDEWLSIGYDKGIITDIPDSEQVLFKSVYLKWFLSKIRTIKPQSVDRIEVTYKKYYSCSNFVELPVHAITEKTISVFLNGIIKERADITYKEYGRISQIVHQVMLYAYELELGHCSAINWDLVRSGISFSSLMPKSKKEYALSDYEKNRLFKGVLEDNVYPQKRCASLCILLNFYLGLRVGELASVRWKDVDYSNSCIYVHSTFTKYYERDENGNRVESITYKVQDTTKTVYSVRKVPLIRESIYLLELIRAHQSAMGYKTEFIAYDGRNTILAKSIERTIPRLCELCGIGKFSSHKIRKTFASELHKNGVPSKYISELMGHSDIKTTERFYILSYADSMEYLRNAMECLKVDIGNVQAV